MQPRKLKTNRMNVKLELLETQKGCQLLFSNFMAVGVIFRQNVRFFSVWEPNIANRRLLT